MDWRAAINQIVIAVASSLVVAGGITYTQVVRLDERVMGQNEQAMLRIELLLDKTTLLREEQLAMRRQILQLQQQVWSSKYSSRERFEENLFPVWWGLADERGKT